MRLPENFWKLLHGKFWKLLHGNLCGRVCAQALRFQVGDEVFDPDGERCNVVSVDAEDFEKPYELEYPDGVKFWAAESTLAAATDAAVR